MNFTFIHTSLPLHILITFIRMPQVIDFKGLSTKGYLRWAVNPLTFRFPATPLLLVSQYGLLNSSIIPQASAPIRIELNDVVQIVLQNHAALNGKCEQVHVNA